MLIGSKIEVSSVFFLTMDKQFSVKLQKPALVTVSYFTAVHLFVCNSDLRSLSYIYFYYIIYFLWLE
jgi:hypothetical protein